MRSPPCVCWVGRPTANSSPRTKGGPPHPLTNSRKNLTDFEATDGEMTPLLGLTCPCRAWNTPASRDLSPIYPTRPAFEIDGGSGATDRRPSDYGGRLLVRLAGVDPYVIAAG